MSTEGLPHTRDELLAREIVKALIVGGLLPRGRAGEVAARIAAGAARESDWNAWALASLAPAAKSDRT